jgi:hypothetical protein
MCALMHKVDVVLQGGTLLPALWALAEKHTCKDALWCWLGQLTETVSVLCLHAFRWLGSGATAKPCSHVAPLQGSVRSCALEDLLHSWQQQKRSHAALCIEALPEFQVNQVLPLWPVLCCAVPCRAVPCRAVPCRAVPCRAVPCRAVPCRAVPCRAVLCCAVLCRP